MSLNTQIILIVVSFFFGVFFDLSLSLCQKIIYSNKLIFKYIFTFIIILIQVLLYFYLILKINNGIIHIYGLLSILGGMIFLHYLKKRVFYLHKKK